MPYSLVFGELDKLDKSDTICYIKNAAARCQPEPLEPARQDREDGGTGTDPRGASREDQASELGDPNGGPEWRP